MLAPYITDRRFSPHLTIYRKCNLSEETKAGVKAAIQDIRMEGVIIEKITLREKKAGPVIKECENNPEKATVCER